MVVNGNTEEHNLEAQTQQESEKSLTASGFLELLVGDSISIQTKSSGTIVDVHKGSMLHVRFHDSLFSMPACSFSIQSHLTVYRSKPILVGPWAKKFKGQFTSASSFKQHLKHIQIPKDGVYLVVVNLITRSMVDTNSQLQLTVGDTAVASRFFFENKQFDIATNSFSDLLSLKETDLLSFTFESDGDIQILGNSTFSVMLVKPDFLDVNGFKMWLDKDSDNAMSDLKSAEYRPVKNWNATGSPYLFKNFQQSTMVDGYSFSIERVDGNGIYYISANIIASVIGAPAGAEVEVSLYKSDNQFFKKKQTVVCTATDSCFFSTNLVAVLQLSKYTPLSITVSGINATKITFHRESSFGMVQTPTVYPGFHSGLTELRRFDHTKKTLMNPWKGRGEGGLYDFTNAFNTTDGVYTTSQKGVYLVTANAIVSDASEERVSLHIVKDDNKLISVGFYSRDAFPSQHTTLNSGGILRLEESQTLSLYVQAEDEDWQVQGGGLGATFLGFKPMYIQMHVSSDMSLRKIEDVTRHPIDAWKEESNEGMQFNGNGIVTLPHDGIYYTVATIIMDDAGQQTASFYKAQLKINDKYANGLYSKRKIGLKTVPSSRSSYSLFFSGSFKATKGSEVFIEIETGAPIGFRISQSSKWALVFIRHTDQLSGGLRILDNDASFKAGGLEWRPLDFVAVTPDVLTDGGYELTKKISFNGATANIYSDGIYIISANIEVEYTGSESTMLQLAVFINDTTVNGNGLNVQKKSVWKAETLHISGGNFSHIR